MDVDVGLFYGQGAERTSRQLDSRSRSQDRNARPRLTANAKRAAGGGGHRGEACAVGSQHGGGGDIGIAGANEKREACRGSFVLEPLAGANEKWEACRGASCSNPLAG